MKFLVFGAGPTGALLAVALHEAGHEVSLVARGERLKALRAGGVLLAEGDSPVIRRVAVPVVERPSGRYDLILVLVRAHQVDAVLESIAGVEGDVLFLLNWAAGAAPLASALGRERILLGFPTRGGAMDGDIVRYPRPSALTRSISMPIGEPDGRSSARVKHLVQIFRSAGVHAKTAPRIDAWLKTHAAFEVPLGQAVKVAGGPVALADQPGAIREMLGQMRRNLADMPTKPVPRAFNALRILPAAALVGLFRRFLRSRAAVALNTDSPAVAGELDLLTDQLRALRKPTASHPRLG